MRPNRHSHLYMITVLFVNATIGFSENLFLVFILKPFYDNGLFVNKCQASVSGKMFRY